MALVAALSLPFLFVLARRPVLRRLAVRNAVRRPRETVLVVAGSLLGTAIITGSFVVGDTLDASLRRQAVTKLGPIDELVRTPTEAAQADLASRLSRLDRRSDDIDGVLPLTVVDAAVVAGRPGAPVERAEPNAEVVEVNFEAARRFGDDQSSTGIEGTTPGPGGAALGEDLAARLEIGPGDGVTAHLYGAEVVLTVERVLPRRGVAGFYQDFGTDSLNLFVTPGTVGALAARAQGEVAPPLSYVAVSNRGGVFDGATRTEVVNRQIADELGALPPGLVNEKQELLAEAEDAGAEFTELFSSIGFFSVLAGVLLLVNIFVMLAQERRSEMGMLRAVGLRRAGLVGSFALEGWLYALGSAVLGAAAGIGLGRVVAGVAAGIFASDVESFELSFAARSASIRQGFTLGFAISLATVVLTSLGIARVNVIRAIRDLPEPARARTRARSAALGGVLAAVGAGLSITGIPAEEPYLTLAGPVVLASGLALLLTRFLPRRAVVSVASVGALVWGLTVFGLLPDAFEGADIPVFVVQGVVLTAAAVALASENQEAVGAGLRRLTGGRSLALRLGLAYPLARRFRTAMILAMYSLVVFTLVFITVFSHLFSGQIERFTEEASGGFDLTVASNAANPVPPEEVGARPEVTTVAALADTDAEFMTPRTGGEFEDWFVTGIDETFVEQGPPALDDRGRYPDQGRAYRAVLADPSLVIVSELFLQGGGGPPEQALEPGQRITLRDPLSGRERELTVAALAKSSFANVGAYISRDSLVDLYGPRVATNRLLVATQPGADVEGLAAELDAELVANGADAESFRHLVSANLSAQTQFFRLMQGYLALGLVVGVAGLGVVMVRAVRERRHQVGVLRALGYQSGAVRRAFTLESAFVALEGIAVGTALAVATAWEVVANDTFGSDLAFSLPWAQLGVLTVATFAASLLATAAPAHQASMIRPAVALRLTD